MNIKKKIKEELLEAAENTKGAEALVLLIGYEDDHSLSNIVGGRRERTVAADKGYGTCTVLFSGTGWQGSAHESGRSYPER